MRFFRRACPLLFCSAAFVSCHRSTVSSTADAAPPSASAPPAASTTASPTTDSDHAAKIANALSIVALWNDAHVRHDASALETLYASTVNFYGTPLTAADCAKKKKAAFAAAPDYVQSVRDVKPDLADAGRIFVRLECGFHSPDRLGLPNHSKKVFS